MPAGYSLPSLLSSYFRETPKTIKSLRRNTDRPPRDGSPQYQTHTRTRRRIWFDKLRHEVILSSNAKGNTNAYAKRAGWTWSIINLSATREGLLAMPFCRV